MNAPSPPLDLLLYHPIYALTKNVSLPPSLLSSHLSLLVCSFSQGRDRRLLHGGDFVALVRLVSCSDGRESLTAGITASELVLR
eukprot:746763-Hanusia_phi.AAC.1